MHTSSVALTVMGVVTCVLASAPPQRQRQLAASPLKPRSPSAESVTDVGRLSGPPPG